MNVQGGREEMNGLNISSDKLSILSKINVMAENLTGAFSLRVDGSPYAKGSSPLTGGIGRAHELTVAAEELSVAAAQKHHRYYRRQ